VSERRSPSAAFGVGHPVAAPASPFRGFVESKSPRFSASFAFAVGQHEDSFAEMRRADSVRAEHTPLRIEPHRGQVAKNVSESSRQETWDVLQRDDSRSHLANHAGDGGPEPTGIVLGSALPGVADWLAREARRDEIHNATPRLAIEGREIIPDRSAIHGRVLHPRHENGRGESVPLNETHATGPGDGELDSKLKSSDAGAD